MPWLTLIGTASIQDYLFRTNKLKENLGGSYLAATAIRELSLIVRPGPLRSSDLAHPGS
jgi:hypothetical protein